LLRDSGNDDNARMTMSQPAVQSSPVNITLPDGSVRTYEAPVTGLAIAESIGAGLAKAAIAMKVNGVQRDLSEALTQDASVALLTLRDAEGLDIMRHTTTAQVLALAIKELWPAAKLAIGPTIEHGFYYDIDLDEKITPDDLPKIESRMREIIARALPVQREMWEREAAIAMFEGRGETYKAELIRNAPEDDTTERGKISLYRQGSGDAAFIDLCRGPHAPSLSKISVAFNLTKLAGAYWRGDSRNKMLQRIYGVSFANDKELKAYLHMMEEAEKRDHRKLGRQLDLFHLQEEAQGSVFWHPHGFTIYHLLEDYIREKIYADGYVEVKTPQLMHSKFWEASGHWSKFRENMFVVPDVVPNTAEGASVFTEEPKEFMALKPMNCPAHIQIFNQGIKSYRDLPLRMAEFGCCHRNESHGSLHGLMRVRQMTQDDAHIFCREDQIGDEVKRFIELFYSVYRDFGFTDIAIRLATRPEMRAGDDATWDRAERDMSDALTQLGLNFDYAPGEGAFYGPKYEFHLKDSIGRSWQCGTLQLDFVLPERLDASYIGEDGQKHRPVMIHRAILGTLERFIGILIEQFAGKFPLWLAPVQVVVAPITNDLDEYALAVMARLKSAGIRAEADLSANKINFKVREHSDRKVPFILAVGGRERDSDSVSVRRLGSQNQQVQTVDTLISMLLDEIKSRRLPPQDSNAG
jgi:threonyl-tRNA synthetase